MRLSLAFPAALLATLVTTGCGLGSPPRSKPVTAAEAGSSSAPSATSAAKPAGGVRTVTYRVTGTGPVDVSYTATADREDTDANGVKTPWTVSVKLPVTEPVTLLVTNPGDGVVSCSIAADGKQLDAKTSGAGQPMLSCMAIVK